jgi:hypothetical protein
VVSHHHSQTHLILGLNTTASTFTQTRLASGGIHRGCEEESHLFADDALKQYCTILFNIGRDLVSYPCWLQSVMSVPGIVSSFPQMPTPDHHCRCFYRRCFVQELKYPLFHIRKQASIELDLNMFLHRIPNCSSKRAEQEEVVHSLRPPTKDTLVVCRYFAILKLKTSWEAVMGHSPQHYLYWVNLPPKSLSSSSLC